VELKINGVSQGTGRSTNHIFSWNDILLAPGENRIEVSGIQDGNTYKDSCSWTYKASAEKP
jgi:hypothetical protein